VSLTFGAAVRLFHMCPEAIGDLSEAERHSLRGTWFPRLMAQRAGTPVQYKRVRWLREKLEKLGPLKVKAARAAEATTSGAKLQHNDRLSAAQRTKLEQEAAWLEELATIEAAVAATAASSVAGGYSYGPPTTAVE
jgi:hypothetical protein